MGLVSSCWDALPKPNPTRYWSIRQRSVHELTDSSRTNMTDMSRAQPEGLTVQLKYAKHSNASILSLYGSDLYHTTIAFIPLPLHQMEDVQWYDKTELLSAVQILQQNPDEALKSR